MVRTKQHLERCFLLPSAISPSEARELFDKAMQHVRDHRPANCDAIISEFAWIDYMG